MLLLLTLTLTLTLNDLVCSVYPEPTTPDTPIPDYEEGESPSIDLTYYQFAAKFGKVLSSIKTIGIVQFS